MEISSIELQSAMETAFRIYHYSVASVGCFLNAFLIYLLARKSPKTMKTYSILIMNFAVTDLIICICDGFVQQRLIPTGTALAFISSGPCTYLGPSACFTA
ncbi:unnamed protein product [Caenorhabditis auriculariae]|uniref:G-protein coupled receptors family 1 profile domain-containing protein n=1 Tax=Caenorhabditis auriculariae TaxID=2777116 RepID=A0A8S1HTY5_9PELO|nr:unnamed protein product [Caenorhabditis auriculariae]